MRHVLQIMNGIILASCMGLILPMLGAAESETTADKTLSPYFMVQSENAETDALPLKSTRAEVTISGVIADVEVTQVYKNQGKQTLEAIYVFPASTRAAVYAMRMQIGERTIEATIQERAKARETYEKALAEGKTASLLEQQRPNVFQMNVGNILPGDEIKVSMKYTELLVPEDGTYEFMYPTVVGPRYSNQLEATAGSQDKWVKNPYLHEGKAAPFTFAFSLKLNSGIPIAQLTSPSHEIEVEYTGKTTAHVTLKESNKTNNRDVVIKYSLAGAQIESGLLMNLGKKEDFFLLMLEPPKRVASSAIVPREYIFVVDVSGSMQGFPLDVTKALMQDLLGHLRPSDFFNVMLFSGGNSVLSEKSLPATAANLKKAIDAIDNQNGGGGTELMPALQRAMALPRAESNISRSMIIVTDGYVSVEKEAFEYIRKHLNQGNVFSFGIGSSVNRFLMEGLARAGMGEPFIILNPEEAKVQAKKFREYVESPVLTDIQVKFNGLKVSEVEPASIPDLFAKKPVVVFGKYQGTPSGTIVITGKTAGKPYYQEIRVSEGDISTQNTALRYLWARHRIMQLADIVKLAQEDAAVKEVTRLGLEYNLLTDYTSFVAVDNIKRTDGKPQTTVKQPLPLPQGVSDSAVGGGTMQGMAACKSAPCASAPAPRSEARRYKMAKQEEACEVSAQDIAAPRGNVSQQDDSKKNNASCQIKVKKIEGGLSQAQVNKAIEAQRSYIEQVIRKAGLNGEYEIELLLDAQGKITQTNVLQETFGNSDLQATVLELLSRLVFPASQDKKAVRIILSITS